MGGPGSQETCLRPKAHKPSRKGVAQMLPRPVSSRNRSALAAVLISLLALLALAAAAPAAGPATVTVQVEGLSETKLPPTQVTTATTPVVKDGNPEHSCTGTSALGALQLATNGNWDGPWSSSFNQYEIYSIMGELHEFEASSKANYYWSFWLDDKEAGAGACEEELTQGDRVLFFPACFGEACPPSPTPLGIEAPAIADSGESVAVTVNQYNTKGEASPAVGATVSGGGVSATTDSQGHATMRFAGDVGTFTLHAYGSDEGPAAVRTETTICVHEGNDGTCGTTPEGNAPLVQSASSTVSTTPYRGPFAVVAKATGVSEGHVYPRGKGPRLLSGDVTAHTAVTSIDIELRRSYQGRCWAYSGTRERFVKARCGEGSFFQVASGGTSFSYLLPAKLAPGRYVLDLQATDTAGNHTTLARGSTRTVFYVR
jgi:hypothetical protein